MQSEITRLSGCSSGTRVWDGGEALRVKDRERQREGCSGEERLRYFDALKCCTHWECIGMRSRGFCCRCFTKSSQRIGWNGQVFV